MSSMKYNFRKSFGFLVLMSIFLVANYSDVRGQNKQITCEQKKADKFLQQGLAAFDKKDYPQAVSFYDQAAKAAPKCAEPYFQKGKALLNAKRFDESIAALQEASKRNFAEPYRLYYGICSNRINQENYLEAVKSCEESVRLNDNFFWSSYDLAKSYFQLNNYEKALPAVTRAIHLDPKFADALQMKGVILLTLKRYDEALIDLTAAAKLNPNEGAFYVIGATYVQLKNYSKALENLSQAVKLNPNFFEAWTLIAASQVGYLQDWKKSEEAAYQAVRIKPDNADANFLLGMAQLSNGKLEASVKSFDTALKNKNTLPATAAVYKGYALIGLKKTAEAEKSFQQALIFKPTNKGDYLALSEIYSYRWELDKAREQIKKGIGFASDDDDSAEYAFLSWNYSLSGEPQEAIIAANESIQQNPRAYDGYTNRCRAYNETSLPDIAIKDCQKALELRPNDSEVFFYMGRAYALKKDTAQEKSFNQKAISSMEKRFGISFKSQKSGKLADVLTASSLSSTDAGKISLNSPSFSYYLYLLGNAYFLDNNFDAAISAYGNVVELRPKFPRLRYNLAVAYLRLKSPDVKNADAQYQALLLLDKKLAADLKKIISGFRRK